MSYQSPEVQKEQEKRMEKFKQDFLKSGSSAGLADFKAGDRVTCTIKHLEPCLPNGIGVIKEIILPDSAYLQDENGNNIGTRGLDSLKKC